MKHTNYPFVIYTFCVLSLFMPLSAHANEEAQFPQNITAVDPGEGVSIMRHYVPEINGVIHGLDGNLVNGVIDRSGNQPDAIDSTQENYHLAWTPGYQFVIGAHEKRARVEFSKLFYSSRSKIENGIVISHTTIKQKLNVILLYWVTPQIFSEYLGPSAKFTNGDAFFLPIPPGDHYICAPIAVPGNILINVDNPDGSFHVLQYLNAQLTDVSIKDEPFKRYRFQNGQYHDIGTLGGKSTIALGVLPAGEIIGNSETSNGNIHGFIWKHDVMTDLGTLGGQETRVSAIDGVNGAIIGWSSTKSGDFHAFKYQNGKMTDLGTLGGKQSFAFDVNSMGQIVGQAFTQDGTSRAFIYENGKMSDLNTILPDQSHWVITLARNISENGKFIDGAGIYQGTPDSFVMSRPLPVDKKK